MKEADVRDYLRQTERRATDAERRLDTLLDLRLNILTRRRAHRAGVVGHGATTVAAVVLVRREIKQQRAKVRELTDEVQRARDWLEEMEERRAQDEAEKERQREEQRRRDEEDRAALEGELEEARRRETEQRGEAMKLKGELRTQTERAVDLEAELALEREERAQEARDREDPGDREM